MRREEKLGSPAEKEGSLGRVRPSGEQASAAGEPRASAPESAKALKAALRAAFPATTFSVRLSRGTGYGMCGVTWTDGPSVKLVEAVVAPFVGEGFDGMTDGSYGIDGRLPDGHRTGLRLINTGRLLSARFVRRLVQAIAEYWGGVEVIPDVIEHAGGSWSLTNGWSSPRPGIGQAWYDLIHRAAQDRQSVTREEVAA
jgi:hypothetical protein